MGFLACMFYVGAYFEPKIDLGLKEHPDEIKKEREARAIGLMFGLVVELVVFVVCLGVLMSKRQRKRFIKAGS